MSALPPEADMFSVKIDVRYVPRKWLRGMPERNGRRLFLAGMSNPCKIAIRQQEPENGGDRLMSYGVLLRLASAAVAARRDGQLRQAPMIDHVTISVRMRVLSSEMGNMRPRS